MPIRDILQIGHPILAQRAAEVPLKSICTDEVQSWVEDMTDTMRNAQGAGIAANQIGLAHRLFVMEVGDNPRYPYMPKVPLTVVINPIVEFIGDETFVSNEGCLSVPALRGDVKRHVQIRVTYYDQNAQKIEQEISGYSACIWQHEYDHLDGILFPHRVADPQSFCSWNVFQEFKQQDYAQHVEALVAKWGA